MVGKAPDWLISPSRALVILPPRESPVAGRDGSEAFGSSVYETMLARVQRLRGRAYLEDGAICQGDLTPDGRHISPVDEQAWHVLSVESGGVVRGCARYLAHDPSVAFPKLLVSNSALAKADEWGPRLREAVEIDMAAARDEGLAYAEVGGWAIDKSLRCGTEAARIALSTYALARRLGGCVGITTATVRHHSAAALQKIGGALVAWNGNSLPYYFDPQYGCEMAILRFRSDRPTPRFEPWIRCLEVQMRTVPIIYSSESGAPAQPVKFTETFQPQEAVAVA